MLKLTNLRRHRDTMAMTRGVFAENPVLFGGLALPLVVAATTSLKNGVALSFGMLLSMVPAMWVACVFGPQIPKMARIPACAVTAMAAIQVAALFIRYLSPSIFDSMGIYFPLLAVNSLMIARATEYAPRVKPQYALLDGAMQSLGFAVVAIPLSLFRELFGYGTVWGNPVSVPFSSGGVLLPFFGFIAVGLLSAFFRWLDRLLKQLVIARENREAAPPKRRRTRHQGGIDHAATSR